MSKLKVALTYGDPEGIGLEILNKILERNLLEEFAQNAEFFIFGQENLINKNSLANSSKIKIQVININNYNNTGDISFRCLEKASEYCINKSCDCLVTGPINKEKWLQAGHMWTGQTEFLGHITKTSPEMLFMTNNTDREKIWRVLLLTRHIEFKKIPENLTFERFKSATEVLQKFLKKEKKFSVAVAGLNPHGGENGHLGQEELTWRAWCQKLNLAGVFSPDSLWFESANNFLKNNKQEFSAYLAPYHDQVLALIKTVTKLEAVNVSLGLPFLRTSPDHGTAYNLVGKEKANLKPFLEAIKTCIQENI